MRARAGAHSAAALARGVVLSQAQSCFLRMAPAAMRSWAPKTVWTGVWTGRRGRLPVRGITHQHHVGPTLHTVMDCSGEKSLRSAVAIAAGEEILAEAGRVVDAPSMHTIQVSDVSESFEAPFEASSRRGCLCPATAGGPGRLAGDKNVSCVACRRCIWTAAAIFASRVIHAAPTATWFSVAARCLYSWHDM